MIDSVTFAWDWKREEYLAAERDSWALSTHRPKAARRQLILSGIGFALFAFVFASRGLLNTWTVVALVVLAFGFPWIGSRIGEWSLPRLRARRFARNCLPAYEHTTATVETAGLTLKWQDSSVQVGWQTFTRVAESAAFVFLYQSPKSSIFLPKRAVSPEDLEAIRRIIQRGMAGRRGQAPEAAA